MAKKIKAINAYCPKVKKAQIIDSRHLVIYISDRTGLNRGDVRQMMDELQDSCVHFPSIGHAVHLDGLVTFSPKINLKGEIYARCECISFIEH